MPKFERKTKEERRREIREAAKKVFLKKGYRNATMEDIVAATSLSKGGVYQYYKSTKAIMFDIMQGGNFFRHSRSREIIKEGLEAQADVFEIMTRVWEAKLFEKVREKKLYLMFLAEIPYDKETEALHRKLEKQSFELALNALEENAAVFPELRHMVKKMLYSDILLYSRMSIGIMMSYELFSDKKIFDSKRDEIHSIIYAFIKKTFE
ncbi:TetR/AcrR family transcriptional regulator [Treponema sp. HNW]|uniref:TetR/AcrR family transcriptional regulator n=1 Tax=Treponema sp. HNW TaxID=3116654 RepID=UPI003D1507FD